MPNDDFDPLGPPRPPRETGNPLEDYLQPPSGLGMLASAQFVLAALMVLLGVSVIGRGQPITTGLALTTLLPAGLLCAAGLGLLLRTGWGWWLTATLYYCVFFNLPVNLVLWTVRRQPFSLGGNLVTVGLAIVTLAYLTRSELLRFIRFSTPDARPTRRMLLSPVLTGLVWATVRLTLAFV